MLFQGGALFDSKNVEENIKFPLDMLTNISEKEKLSITKKLCNSLKEIHSRNIIHCDIKNNNIGKF